MVVDVKTQFSAVVGRNATVSPLHPAGTPWLAALTPGERDILTLLARRLSNPQIAETLALAPPAVEQSLAALYRKLAVRTRDALAVYAQYLGLGVGD